MEKELIYKVRADVADAQRKLGETDEKMAGMAKNTKKHSKESAKGINKIRLGWIAMGAAAVASLWGIIKNSSIAGAYISIFGILMGWTGDIIAENFTPELNAIVNKWIAFNKELSIFIDKHPGVLEGLRKIGHALSMSPEETGDILREKWSENFIKIGMAATILAASLRWTWETIKTTLKDKWETIRTTAGTKFEEIKTIIGEKWDETYTTVVEKVQLIMDYLPIKWETIKTGTDEWWGKIKDAIWKPIEEAWNKVKEYVTKILTALARIPGVGSFMEAVSGGSYQQGISGGGSTNNSSRTVNITQNLSVSNSGGSPLDERAIGEIVSRELAQSFNRYGSFQ